MSDKAFDMLTNDADAWCACVSDFGPATSCARCDGSGRDPDKWLAWKSAKDTDIP